MSRHGLSPAEDAELRRLHYFRRFGHVTEKVLARYTELRNRDRRAMVRDPEEHFDATPGQANDPQTHHHARMSATASQ
jgi:hypothetical protein